MARALARESRQRNNLAEGFVPEAPPSLTSTPFVAQYALDEDMAMKQLSRLALALRKRLLVRFTRPFEQGSVNGYVLDIGPRFFIVALVGEGGWFNGFGCFRLSDVRELQAPAKYAEFTKAALKIRGERIPKKPRVTMGSLQELLRSSNRTFPLVTIHREKVDPGVCHIGRVMRLSTSRMSLLEIGPDARWDREPIEYRLSEVTEVDFGGDYEEALHLVGGAPRTG